MKISYEYLVKSTKTNKMHLMKKTHKEKISM